MSFRFTLQTVLRLRQIAEEREERAMEQILRKMAQQRQELTDLAASRRQLIEQGETMLRAKISAAELLLLRGQIRALEDREANGRKHLSHLEQQRQEHKKVYEAAHRNRELLSRMREQQMEQFKRVQVRKEQMQMDDIFSCRRTSA